VCAYGGCGVYDYATAIGPHVGNLILHRQEHAGHVHCELAVPGGLVHVSQRPCLENSRVVERDVQSTVAAKGGLDQPGGIGGRRDIGDDRAAVATFALDQAHGLIERFTTSAGDRHGRALAREGKRGGTADARPAAGYEDYLASEPRGHSRSSCEGSACVLAIANSAKARSAAFGFTYPDRSFSYLCMLERSLPG
jgi:hypothetical protein